MKVTILDEPELEFHGGTRHVDPRHGITDYGPADATADSPRSIRIGVVGTPHAIDGVRRFLDSCRRPIAAKESDLGHLFLAFPGFDHAVGFRSTLVFDSRLERPIRERDLAALQDKSPDHAVRAAVDLYLDELDTLNEEAACDVVLVARPDSLPEGSYVTPPKRGRRSAQPQYADFHATLKAEALRHSRPLQLIRRSTWDPTFKSPPEDKKRSRQDPATSAWNLHAALYYKAGGVPWRLRRSNDDLTTCFVGVAFYRATDDSRLETSIAQVFNQRGDGMIVRGGPAKVSRDDRQPHLTTEDAEQLLKDSMLRYRKEHRTLPARVVLHKSSSYTPAEIEGFHRAAETVLLDTLELVWIASHESIRLFREGANPPLRGTMLSVDGGRHSLYTRGSVPFYRTYPGMYVPDPLPVRTVDIVSSPEVICEEILALTKMNWNQTQMDTRRPITLETARKVGDILRRLPDHTEPQGRYAFYM